MSVSGAAHFLEPLSIFNQPSLMSIPETLLSSLEQRLLAPGSVIMLTQKVFCATLSVIQQAAAHHTGSVASG